jgi:hypothetical protein
MYAARLSILLGSAFWAVAPGASPNAFGIWKMNPARSALTGDAEAKDLTMRFEPHAKGEVFTLDRTGRDGRITTSSTLLYLDGNRRSFEDRDCSGTQSSRRVDNQTVEILRTCASGAWIRIVRRLGAEPKELIIEMTEQHSEGRRSERRLLLEKQ